MPIEDVIEANQELVLELFALEVGARGASARPQSIAAMRQFLPALAYALRRNQRDEPESLRVAREHGGTMARMHYEVDAVLREFLSLRTAIVEVLRRRGAPNVDDVERVTDHVHTAMFAAVRELLKRSHGSASNVRQLLWSR